VESFLTGAPGPLTRINEHVGHVFLTRNASTQPRSSSPVTRGQIVTVEQHLRYCAAHRLRHLEDLGRTTCGVAPVNGGRRAPSPRGNEMG
jgi:hypothetical protein